MPKNFWHLAPQSPNQGDDRDLSVKQANTALTRLREGKLTGAAVLVPQQLSRVQIPIARTAKSAEHQKATHFSRSATALI